MKSTLKAAWDERRRAWRRYEALKPPPSARERATRLTWLDEILRLARERGLLREEPLDSPEIRARRQRIRDGLAKIRD